MLLERLDAQGTAHLRLVCSDWRDAVDDVLEHLDLAAFPEEEEWVDRIFPSLKSLQIVRPRCAALPASLGPSPAGSRAPSRGCSESGVAGPGSNPPASSAPAPNAAADCNAAERAVAAADASTSGRRRPPAISLSALAQQSFGAHPPQPAGTAPAGDPAASTAGHDGLPAPPTSEGPSHAAAAGAQQASAEGGGSMPLTSPHTQYLGSILRALQRRRVPLRRLAIFYDSEESAAHVPPGLLSLTIVHHSEGKPGTPVAPSPSPALPQLSLPRSALPALSQLGELCLVAGAPDLHALAQLPLLRKLTLQPGLDDGVRAKSTGTGAVRSRPAVLGPELAMLTSLRELHITKVRLGSLPPLGGLRSLSVLSVASCHLARLPASLPPALSTLLAPGNPDLELPEELRELTGLASLDLSWTRADLRALLGRSADRAHDRGYLPALTELRLVGNHMRAVPGGLCGLSSLRTLLMSVNQVETLPNEMSRLTTLTHLDVSINHMTSLGGLPRALVRLSAQTNALHELPAEMSQLAALQWLDVSNNSLVKLPKKLRRIKKLHTLRLSFNQLESLSYRDLEALPELRRLEAYYACRMKSRADSARHEKALLRLRRRRPKLSIGYMNDPAEAAAAHA